MQSSISPDQRKMRKRNPRKVPSHPRLILPFSHTLAGRSGRHSYSPVRIAARSIARPRGPKNEIWKPNTEIVAGSLQQSKYIRQQISHQCYISCHIRYADQPLSMIYLKPHLHTSRLSLRQPTPILSRANIRLMNLDRKVTLATAP